MKKVTYRIPTKDQYAFVEIIEEHEVEIEPLAYRQKYDELREVFLGETKPGGLDTKTFNSCLDEFCLTGSLANGTEFYAAMNPAQQSVFQELKKCFARIKKVKS